MIRINKKYLCLVVFVILTLSNIKAQKHRVLVVLYDRFQFSSQYSLDEIAAASHVESSEVFNEYHRNINAAFESYNSENFEFVAISNLHSLGLRKQTSYKYGKFDKKKYYSINLSMLSNEEFTQLANNYNVDFVLFVNWYNIEKTIHTNYVGDNNKRLPFSLHKIDYELYNSKKIKLFGDGNVKINCGNFPTLENQAAKGLNPKLLTPCYNNLFKEILSHIDLN